MRILILTSMIVLGACSASADDANATAGGPDAATADSAAADIDTALDPASATAFVDRIYAHYGEGGNGQNFDDPSSLFEPALAAAIAADAQASQASGEVGRLDFDPFCQCQDWAPFTARLSGPEMEGDTTFIAASFDGFGDGNSRTVEIHLVPVDGEWRVSDIVDDEGGSFRDLMMSQD